jgi:RNA polymerase primary sigma factor
VDLVDVEVEEITVDAGQAKTPSGCGALDPVWDEAEFRALRQAGKDAELTASAGSVRAYLQRISKVVLQEVDLAKAIEAGLFAAERMRRAVYPHSMSREIHLYSFSAAQTK